MKCILCHKNEGIYNYYDDSGLVCKHCAENTFQCADCGKVFPDYTYDAGGGLCKDCKPNH